MNIDYVRSLIDGVASHYENVEIKIAEGWWLVQFYDPNYDIDARVEARFVIFTEREYQRWTSGQIALPLEAQYTPDHVIMAIPPALIALAHETDVDALQGLLEETRFAHEFYDYSRVSVRDALREFVTW